MSRDETTDDISDQSWRIGEIAQATGFTVRALRHYEEIGLLNPTSRSAAGQRLYGPQSVEQLYRISALQRLGLSLTQVQLALAENQTDALTLIGDHLRAVEERLVVENRLRSRLVQVVQTLGNDEDATRDLMSILEDMNMTESLLERRIAILVYEDIEAACSYLTRVFGFGPGEITRDPDGTIVHGEVQAGDGEFWLHLESEEYSLQSPKNLGSATATMAVMVEDVDAHHERAAAEGAEIRYQPIDQPYGYREYSAVDCEGHLWSFMKPLPDEASS